MALLNKASFLSGEYFQYAIVPVPELGGEMRVRGLSAYEQSVITKKVNQKQMDDLALVVCVMGCVDENGERIFTVEDKEALKTKPYAVLDRLAKKILELSGSGEDGIETAEKN